MHSFCQSSVNLLQVSIITYCWLTNIEQPAPIPPKKYVKRIGYTDIHGRDFEDKINLFPMAANWNREKSSNASYEMFYLQPTFFC